MIKTLLLTVLGFTYLQASEIDTLLEMSLEDLLNVEVTTTSKYAEKIYDSPANIHIISREQIDQRGYQDVTDILRSLPGVDLQEYDIIGIYNTFTFRGAMDNNKFLILKDGVRISAPAGEITAVADNFPLYFAKRVEVLVGPASVIYGADAFAGVVNIITMDKDDENLLEVQLTAGTDDYGYGYANLNQHFQNGMHLNLGVQGYSGQDLKLDEDYEKLYDDPTKSYDMAKTKEYQVYSDFRFNENVKVGLHHSSIEYSNDFTSKPSFSAYDSSAITQESMTTLYAQFDFDISSKLHSKTLLTYMNYEMDNHSGFNNLFTGFTKQYKYAKSDRYSLNQDFIYELGDNHLLSAGFVYDYFDIIPRGPDLPSPYDTDKSPNDQNLWYPNTTLSIEFFDNTYETAGIYIQDNWKINEAWRVVAGLRYDHSSFYGDSTNPRLSTIYKHDEQNIFKLMYGHSFLAPAPNQAFTSFGSFDGTQTGGLWNSTTGAFGPVPFRVPNPDLKPEHLKTLELNYEHFFHPHAHIKFAPFYTRISDVVSVQTDAIPDQAINGANLLATSKFQNSGKSEIYGIDISSEYNAEYENFKFNNWGSFSYIDGKLKENGVDADLPMLSHYKLKGGSTIIYKGDYLVTPMFRWISGAHRNVPDDLFNDPATRSKVASYFIMDMHAEVKVTKNFGVKADISNLFDKQHYHAPFPSTFLAFDVAPQPGRLITGSLYYRF